LAGWLVGRVDEGRTVGGPVGWKAGRTEGRNLSRPVQLEGDVGRRIYIYNVCVCIIHIYIYVCVCMCE
jgi:hypothetical protein